MQNQIFVTWKNRESLTSYERERYRITDNVRVNNFSDYWKFKKYIMEVKKDEDKSDYKLEVDKVKRTTYTIEWVKKSKN